MNPFLRVVAATDFSAAGDAAVREAFRVAGGAGARVDLLHVLERVATPNPLYAHYQRETHDPAAHRALVAEVEAALRERVPREPRRIEARVHVREGHAAEEIVALAAACEAELVVVGTHGRGAVERLLMGSVAERVVRLAPCSVLVARAAAPT